jgi:hypothetical protein
VRQKAITILTCFVLSFSAAEFTGITEPNVVIAHGGRLDGNGCHNDRQRGGYHCHRGPSNGQSFASRAAAERAMNASSTTPAPPRQPTTAAPAAPATTSATSPSVPYDRALYRHWIDGDGDCQDTRQEVLIAESLEPPELDDRGCRVESGRWSDPFTGQTFTDPGDLDIDHIVPLAEAHRSGADTWTAGQREAYANDLFHTDALIAVSASANRSKGDRDPAEWLPPNEAYRCEYLKKWVVVKATWGLVMDTEEAQEIQVVLSTCN